MHRGTAVPRIWAAGKQGMLVAEVLAAGLFAS